MGNSLIKFWERATKFPAQGKPIAFHLQKNSTSTGEEKRDDGREQTDAYDELQNAFIKRVAEARSDNENWFKKNFPYWNRLTIDNLQNVFIQLALEDGGMIDYRRFCWFLDSIGDNSSPRFREDHFNSADGDDDGLINIDEFLILVYNFHPLDDLEGVPRICLDIAEKIRSVSCLSVGEQLQHGLF